MLPWWTPPTWKIAFWRPLCSLTHWFDWRVFGDHAWVMHLHNLLWYGVLIFVLTLLYKRFLTPAWAAGLAALLYTLDAAHAFPVGWIATRNAAFSSVFIVLVLYFHDRWRRDEWRAGFPLALVALALGLLASEATVAVGAYLFAYAAFVDAHKSGQAISTRWLKSLIALLPYLAVVIVWRIVYQKLGYGVGGTLLYTDPIHEPLRLAIDVVRFLPAMLFCQFGASDPAVFSFLPPLGMGIYLGVAVVFLLTVAYVLWPLLRRDPVARFWAVGMVLSALPVCTTIPQGRELMNPGIGAMALVAQFLVWRFTRDREMAEPRTYAFWARTVAIVWIVLHIFVSAVALPVNSYAAVVKPERTAKMLNDTAPADAELTHQTLIIVYTVADLLGMTLPIMRAVEHETLPQRELWLCAGVHALAIERPDERTLILRPDDTFLTRPWSQIFCNPVTNPMHARQTINLSGLDIEVTSVTPDGRPREFLCRFAVPLEDPSLRWVTFENRRYVPFTPPPIGATIHINGPTFAQIARWFVEN
jgi:hypothetical protein